jgi:hypothetical protein
MNIFTERLWRSVKYEEVYLRDYEGVDEARSGLGEYFRFYNTARPHQSLGYRTPAEVHFGTGDAESNNVTGGNKKEKGSKKKEEATTTEYYLKELRFWSRQPGVPQ